MKNSLHSLLGKEAKSMTMKQNLETNSLTDLYKVNLSAMQISIMAPKILKWAKKEYGRVVSIFGQAVIPQSIRVYNFIYVPSDDEPLLRVYCKVYVPICDWRKIWMKYSLYMSPISWDIFLRIKSAKTNHHKYILWKNFLIFARFGHKKYWHPNTCMVSNLSTY